MAIIYQKDKNAIKFIKDFYKQITNKVPSDPQVDSILANFDGNYDSMIRGMYVNLLGKSPSDDQVNQVVNRYLLKKKDSANGSSGLATGGSALLETKKQFKTDLNLKTTSELQKGLEGAKEGTSATLNYKDKKARTLEGRQSYPIDVYADGEYQGVLNPGEKMTTAPASKIVEMPKGKPFKAQTGAQVPFVNNEQQITGPMPSDDSDVWDYDEISKNYFKNGSVVPFDQVPVNIKNRLELKKQEEIDIKNLNKSRKSEEVKNNLLKIKQDKDFQKYLQNTSDTTAVFKVLELYNENPNANINDLIEQIDPKTPSQTSSQLEGDELIFNNTLKISDRGKDIMRMSDENSGDNMFTIPMGKIDPSNPEASLTVNQEGFANYEALLNLNEQSKIMQNELDVLIEKKTSGIKGYKGQTLERDFNSLDEEEKNRYQELREGLNKTSKHRENYLNKIKLNNQKVANNLLNINQQSDINKYAIGNIQELHKVTDPENRLKNLDFGLVTNNAIESLRYNYTPEYATDKFIDNYQMQNGDFKSLEQAQSDTVFINGVEKIGKQYNMKAVTNAAKILNVYDAKNITYSLSGQVPLDVSDYQESDLYNIEVVNQAIRDKSSDIRDLKNSIKNEKDEAKKAEKEQRLSNMINVEMANLMSKHNEIKSKHYDVENQIADPITGVGKDGAQLNSNVAKLEKVLIAQYKTGYSEGEKLDKYTKARNKSYSTKLAFENAYNNQKFELPGGQSLTLSEMKKLLFEEGLQREIRASDRLTEMQILENQLEEDGVGVGLIYGLSQLDSQLATQVIKRTGGPREFGEDKGFFGKRVYKREDFEAMMNHLSSFREKYNANLTEFLAISNALAYNIDFSKIYEGRGLAEFMTQLGQGFSTGMTKTRNFSDADIVNNMVAISKKNGIPLTEMQEEEGEQDFSDMLAYGMGNTFAIMSELMLTLPLSYGAVGAVGNTLTKIPRFAKLADRVGSTKLGAFTLSLAKDMTAGGVGFEATSGDVAGWEMGAAEGFVQSSFNSLMNAKGGTYTRLLQAMYKGLGERVPIKALYYPQRITAGGMAETLAEYAGEYADALSDNGHDWEKNYDRVFGRTRDERLKKLGVTMVMTFGMSTAFTVATSNAIEGEIKAMMNGTSDLTNTEKGGTPLSESDMQHAEGLLNAKAEYRNSALGEQVSDLEERTYREAEDMTPEILQPINSPLPKYIINGKSVGKRAMESLMSDPLIMEKIKDGSINVRVENDLSFEEKMDEMFDGTELIRPDNHGTSYGQEAFQANVEAAKGRVGEMFDNLINESINKGQENVSEYGKNELFLRMNNIEEYYQIYNAALKAGDWNTIQRFADAKFNYTPDQLKELKDRFDSDISDVKKADQTKGEIETEGEIKSRAVSFADQLDSEFAAKGVMGIKNQFYNGSLDKNTVKAIADKLQSRYGDIETNIILNAVSDVLDGNKPNVSLTPNQERIVNRFMDRISLNDISGLLQNIDGLTEPLPILETFKPVQSWARKLDGKDRQNVPFSYNHRTKDYRGVINGVDFTIVKKLGGGFIELNSGVKIGDTKAEAIDYLTKIVKSENNTLSELRNRLGRDVQSIELQNILKIITESRSNSTASQRSQSDPEDGQQLVDRVIGYIDDRLDFLARNKDGNIRSDIFGGLGTKDAWIDLAQGILRAIKAGLIAGKSLSNSINNAFKNVDAPEDVKQRVKNHMLFGVTNINKNASKIYDSVKGNKNNFIKALEEKYPKQFNTDEANMLHQMMKRTNLKDPKISKSLYKGKKLRSVENAIRLEEESNLYNLQNPNMQLQPYEISKSKMNYPKFGKDGEVVIKQYDFEIIKAPVFDQIVTPGVDVSIQENEKVEFASKAMLDEYQRSLALLQENNVDLKAFSDDAIGWYSRVNDYVQEKFGANSQVFFELIAVTSPQATPANNYKKAMEAANLYSQGKLDRALEIYRELINPVIKQHADGIITETQATNKIKSLSNHEKIIQEIRKARGGSGTFGSSSNSGIIRVLHGNWLDSSPALKTQQFYQNLSQRDHNATIDVWAARFMRRLLYDSVYKTGDPAGPKPPAQPIFWRRRQIQETGVSDPDFLFSQKVFADFTSRYKDQLGLGDVKIEDVQALFWHLEKFHWDKMGYSTVESAKDLATLDTEVLAMEATERVVVGSTAYIGKENEQRIKTAVNIQVKKAIDRGATEQEISHIIDQTLRGAVRMDQAKKSLKESMSTLNPIISDVRIGEGVYMNETEPSIIASAVIAKGTDVSNVVDQTIENAINNNQWSVFVSKTVDASHPNARPYARIEFNQPIKGDQKTQIMNVMDKNGIYGYTFNYTKNGEIIGVEFQSIPEFDMVKASGPIEGGNSSVETESGLVIDESFNAAEFMLNLNIKFDQKLDDVKQSLGVGNINIIEKGYVNTKLFTNGEYESITQNEKSFETDLKTELIRRQATLDNGLGGEDITDIRGGYDENARGIQGYEKLIKFADRIDDLYNKLGTQDGVLYSDFGFISAMRVALKLGSVTLRATGNIAKTIDRMVKYLKDNNEWNIERETFLKDYFKEDISEDMTFVSKNGKNSVGDPNIDEGEVSNMEEDEAASALLSEEQQNMKSQNANPKDGYSKEDFENIHDSVVGNHRVQMSGGKYGWFSRLKDFLRNPLEAVGGEIKEGMPYRTRYEQFKTWAVEPKYLLKKDIQRIAEKHDLGETAFANMMSMVTWANAPGAAKHYLFNNVNPIFMDMQADQIEKVGTIGMLRRVIELDNVFDSRKLTMDELMRDVNSGQLDKNQQKSVISEIKKLFSISIADKKGEFQYQEGAGMAIIDPVENNKNYRVVLAKDGVPVKKQEDYIDIPEGLQMSAKKDWQFQESWSPGNEVSINPWRLIHPSIDRVGIKDRSGLVLNKEIAEGILKNYNDPSSTTYDSDFEYLNDKATQVFQVHKSLLKEKYDTGLIERETYEELKDLDYIPRKFIDYFHLAENDPMALRDDSQPRVNNVGNTLAKLKLGSDKVLLMDPVRLLQSSVAAHFNLTFTNKALKDLHEMMTLIEEAEVKPEAEKTRYEKVKSNLFGYGDSENTLLRNVVGYTVNKSKPLVAPYVGVNIWIDGKKQAMALTPEMHASLFARSTDLSSSDQFRSRLARFSSITGGLLKTYATGPGNPNFFLKNFLYDTFHQIVSTETYNNNYLNRVFLPSKIGYALKDWVAVFPDAAKYILKTRAPKLFRDREGILGNLDTPKTDDYFLKGGSLDYLHLTGVNTIRDKITATKSPYEKAIDALMKEEGIEYSEARIRISQAEASGQLFVDLENQPMSNPNFRGGMTAVSEFLSSLNGLTELMGRLANRDRWIKNQTRSFRKKHGRDPNESEMERIKEIAAAHAVDYANFNSGGRGIKNLDRHAGFAYINAAAVTFDKSVRNFARNPVQNLWDFAQAGFYFGALLMGFNLMFKSIKDDEKQEEIDLALDRNLIAQQGNKYKSITSSKKLEKMLDAARKNGAMQEASMIELLINLREQEDMLKQESKDNIDYVYDRISPYDKANHMPIILPFGMTEYIDLDLENEYKKDLERLNIEFAEALYGEESSRAEDISKRIREIEKLQRKNKIVKASYLKMPTEPKLDALKLPFEDLAYQQITGRPSLNRRKSDYTERIKSALPAELTVPGILSSNPLLSAAVKLGNYDLWRRDKVWKGDPDLKGYLRVDDSAEPGRDQLLVDLNRGLAELNRRYVGDENSPWKGLDVANLKGAGSSIFTNLDRNPWYQVINSAYIVTSDPFKKDANRVITDNYHVNFMNDFFGSMKDVYVSEIDFTRDPIDSRIQNSKEVSKRIFEIDAVFDKAIYDSYRANGIVWDSFNEIYVNKEGNSIDHPLTEDGQVSEAYLNEDGSLKNLTQILKTVKNEAMIQGINTAISQVRDIPGFETYVPDVNDFRQWTSQFERNLKYEGLNPMVSEMVRTYRIGQKDLAAWNFVTAEQTSDQEDRMGIYTELLNAAKQYNIDVDSFEFKESLNKYRDWYKKYKSVLQKEDQGLIGPEETKLVLDSLKGTYTNPNVNYDLLLKDVYIPRE